MTRQKQLIMGASFTLLTLSLVAIKLIRWHSHGFFSDLAINSLPDFLWSFPVFVTYIVAVFGIITFWLPPKPQFVFGIVALSISGGSLLCEILVLGWIPIVFIFSGKTTDYLGVDPFFSMLIIAQTAVALGMGRKWHNEAKRRGE